QEAEEPVLPREVHRVDQGLVAVPEVGRDPDRRRVEDPVGPRPSGEIDRRERPVLLERHAHVLTPCEGAIRRRRDATKKWSVSSVPPTGGGRGRAGGGRGSARAQGLRAAASSGAYRSYASSGGAKPTGRRRRGL